MPVCIIFISISYQIKEFHEFLRFCSSSVDEDAQKLNITYLHKIIHTHIHLYKHTLTIIIQNLAFLHFFTGALLSLLPLLPSIQTDTQIHYILHPGTHLFQHFWALQTNIHTFVYNYMQPGIHCLLINKMGGKKSDIFPRVK